MFDHLYHWFFLAIFLISYKKINRTYINSIKNNIIWILKSKFEDFSNHIGRFFSNLGKLRWSDVFFRLFMLKLRKEWMLQGLFCSYTIWWLLSQHHFQQFHFLLFQLIISCGTEIEIHVFVVFVNLVVFCALKQWFFHQKNVENDSCWEYVTLGLNMDVFGQWDDLRSNISRGSTSVKQVLVDICMSGQTKIDNYWVHWILISEHYIFWLQISVHYSVLMHVGQTLQKSLHECFYLQLGKISFILKLIEYLPSEFCGKVVPLIKPPLRRKSNSMIQTHFQVLKYFDRSGFSLLSINWQDFLCHSLLRKCFAWKMLSLRIFSDLSPFRLNKQMQNCLFQVFGLVWKAHGNPFG